MVCRRSETQCHPVIRTRLALFEVLCKRSLGEGILIERCPVLQTELLRGSIGTLLLHFLRPVVGLFDNLKLDSGVRIADLVQFDFDEEETDVFIRMVVQPFNGCTVFLSGAFYNPYYDICTFAGCVCNQLAEVIVVGIL